jgi:PEP-utilising enzyme, PEP-binding domain
MWCCRFRRQAPVLAGAWRSAARTSETWIAATGGEAASVALCHELGLDYVSCSPYRVPLARLGAAQAALKECRVHCRRRMNRELVQGALRAVLGGVALVTLFAFFFVYPAHDPEPNGLPVAVVDDGSRQSQRVLRTLEEGDDFDVVRVADEPAAREAVLDREAYGAVVPGAPPKVLVASAASLQASLVVLGVAAAALPRAETEDLRELDDDDPRNVSINLTGLAVTITSILGALLLFNFAPALPAAWRIGSLAVFALLGGAMAMLVIQMLIGALPGSYFAVAAVTALAIFAVASVSAAIIGALGFPGVGLSFVIFLMLGNPGSGAASAPELLPEPWKTGGQLLPPGAAMTGLRNVAYFDGAQAWKWLTVLVVYAALGTAGLILLGRRRELRQAPPAPA